MNTNTIQITLEVDDKGTVKIKQFGDEAKKTAKDTESSLSILKEGWIGLTAKIAAATAVIYGVQRVLGSFVNEAAEAESIEKRLQFALEMTGYSWKVAKEHVDRYAQSIQETTRFSDEQARQALTDLMMYTQDFSKAQMGAKLAMDMSVRTGHDLGSATRLIGMAMTGNVEMLGHYIPQLRNLDDVLGKDASMAEKAAYAMKILQEKFGGTAQADLDTYAGKMAQLKNVFSDLKETIGGELLPPLKKMIEYLNEIGRFYMRPEILEFIKMFGGLIPGGSLLSLLAAKIQERKFEEVQGMLLPGHGPRAADLISKKDIFPGIKKEIDIVKEVQAAIEGVTAAEELRGQIAIAQHELMEGGWSKEKDIVEQVREEIGRLERETNELGEIAIASQELKELGWEKEIQKIKQWEEEILNARELLSTIRMVPGGPWTGAEFIFPTEDILPDWMIDPKTGKPVLVEKWKDEMTQWQSIWANSAQGIANIWTSSFSQMRRSGEGFSEWFKGMWLDMADYAIGQIMKIMANYILMGNIKGQEITGGLFGWIGSAVGLQEGGQFWANRPTPIVVGEGGRREFVSVIPESKIGAKGQTIIHVHNNYFYLQDVQTARDFVRRNRVAYLEIIQEDADEAGPMRYLG